MLISVALGSLIGATALNFFSFLPSPLLIIAFFLLSLAGIGLVICFVSSTLARQGGIIALSIVLGFVWAYTHAWHRLSWSLDPAHINQPVPIVGKVVGITQWNENRLRFDLQLLKYADQPVPQSVKVRLYWTDPTLDLRDGDKIHTTVKLKPIWHLANPGTFDNAKQLFLEEIRATGKVLTVTHFKAGSKYTLNRLRQHLNDQMGELLKDKPLLGVIQATTLGLYKNITPQQWSVFQITGTSHAIAISGLHISLVAMLFFKLISGIIRRFPYLTSLWPASCYGAVAAIGGALIYSALAGFSLPTQRSLIMIVVAMLSLLLRRPILTWHGLALAWLGIAFIDPLAPLQMGFWLSFVSVAALIYGATHSFISTKWHQWFWPQWVAFIGILPLSVLFFHQVTWLAPLANILTLPLINLVVVPASLIALFLIGVFPGLAKLCLWLAHTTLAVTWYILEKISHLLWGVWQQSTLPAVYFIVAFGGCILLLAPKGWGGRYWGMVTFLPILFYIPPTLKPGECRFTLLDVGQGLASVIQTRHHVLIYDTGPQYGKEIDAGQRIIKPYLKTQNIQRIDKVVISHSDLDHRAGLKSLLTLPIRSIVSSEPDRLRISTVASRCIAGETWEWDGVRFTFLNPSQLYSHRNDLSCVLKVQTPDHSILLTGDIETAAEKRILEQYPHLLKSSILVVPHHGSLTSSSPEFVAKVAPQYALYPVGWMNHYSLPKEIILKRYEAAGSINLQVHETGALIFYLRKGDLTAPVHWRDTARRYWHLSSGKEK